MRWRRKPIYSHYGWMTCMSRGLVHFRVFRMLKIFFATLCERHIAECRRPLPVSLHARAESGDPARHAPPARTRGERGGRPATRSAHRRALVASRHENSKEDDPQLTLISYNANPYMYHHLIYCSRVLPCSRIESLGPRPSQLSSTAHARRVVSPPQTPPPPQQPPPPPPPPRSHLHTANFAKVVAHHAPSATRLHR